ncbi:MAG TPA: TOBE-like domain-containing protein, partial [Planctomycetaceae bacterium]|nr:TOBE-like domain-containing protein [Planctomycetaceae bacterium]
THDQEEAFEVADQVVVMRAGRVEQAGTPQEVFDHPANPFVMDFLGNVNVFHGRAQDGKVLLGGMEVAYPEHPHAESKAVMGYVRPHELDIDRVPTDKSSLQCTVMQINPAGSVAKVRVMSEEFGIAVNVDLHLERYSELKLKTGEVVYVAPRRVRVFSPDDYVI